MAAVLRRSLPLLCRTRGALDQAPAATSAGYTQLSSVTDTQRQRLAFAASFRRGYAADAVAELGQSATSIAVKNPTPNIQYYEGSHARLPAGDPSKRAFHYFVLSGGRFVYASAVRLLVLKFILSMQASKDVLALASLEVDISKIELGQTVVVKWRGKPVFIKHRTEADIQSVATTNMAELRDPQTDADRAATPEWLVVLGVCTHLGCVPTAGSGDYGGWFCPCHGSHYDGSGRIRKGPAPLNLEVPDYKFMDDGKLLIG